MNTLSAAPVSRASRASVARIVLFAALFVWAFAVLEASAYANSPNPTSVHINSEILNGSNLTVTVSGTWTWDKRVPNGAQLDCNDSRIGVGYAVGWGDNQVNPLKPKNSSEIIYVGDSNDDWVHSVTQGTQTVDGAFKKGAGAVTESMLGETPDAVLNGFGPQGISNGAGSALPGKADAENWVSNCGPTAQSVVNGQTIGNSNPSNPTQGYPNGTWGPISHTYTSPGPHKICPVMYDPHGNEVGASAGSAKEIIAGGTGHNGDNSVESNENANPCVVSTTPPEPAFQTKKEQRLEGQSPYTTAKLFGKLGQRVEYKITVTDSGNTSLSLAALNDPKCDAGTISAPSQNPIKPGESAFYTCSHVLSSTGLYVNVAIVTGTPPEGPPITHETPPVEVEVPAEPGFEAKKEQRFEGEAAYTTAKLTGKLGQKVEYKIIVKDTGNTSLTLGPLSDPKCDAGTISAPSQSPIAPGDSAFYTCNHTLSSLGIYTNVAVVTGTPPGEPPITHETPPVEVEVPAEPAFEIKKEQRFEGEGAYTTAKLTGKLGQKVEYKIIVRDTGNTSLTLKGLNDPKCDSGTLSGPSQNPIKPGESASFSCSHVLSSVGVYTNVATETAEGSGKELTHTSNEVEVEAKREPGFEAKKEQRFEGEAAYTTAKLTGKLGQKVEYKIIVKDTGNTSLTLGPLSDPKCDAGTISAPSQSPIAPGDSAFYTCNHTLSSLGIYTNVAVVTGTPPGEPPITHETPPVEVEGVAPAKQQVAATCSISEATILLRGVSGSHRAPFSVRISSLGIKQITFYLDGRKLKTLTSAQAKGGQFSLTINPRKLSYGAHTISARTLMGDANCPPLARAAVFVHPRPPVVRPRFTG